MGGSSSKTSTGGGRKPRPGGAGVDGRDNCPTKFKAIISAPARGLSPRRVARSIPRPHDNPLSRIAGRPDGCGTTVGSLTGIPDLDVLIRCLEAGVTYRAYVESVAGGRVDVTVIRQ